MFRVIITFIMGIFLIVILGGIILETFPQLVPLWEEFKGIVVNLYETSTVRYGTLATVAIIFGLAILLGSSTRKAM